MDVETLKLLVGVLGMGGIVGFIAIKVILVIMPKQLEAFTAAQDREREAFRVESKLTREHSDRQLDRILSEHREESKEAWERVSNIVATCQAKGGAK